MKLIDGHDVIEHAEVNGESREFVRKLTDYIEDADAVEAVPMAELDKAYAKGREIEHRWWSRHCAKCGDAVEPKQGEWIDIGGYEVCKNCHEVKRFPHWNFCPLCGADMRRKERA